MKRPATPIIAPVVNTLPPALNTPTENPSNTSGQVNTTRILKLNSKGEDVKREVDLEAVSKIGKGLKCGWVVSFPQGTTRAFAPLRKGTAHLIKGENPLVVPVRINGFRRAFDKKGLLMKKRNTNLTVEFREPIRFNPEDSVDAIMQKLTMELGLDLEDANQD